jgi:spore germination cell wall hydrolase CwlJ-like protein
MTLSTHIPPLVWPAWLERPRGVARAVALSAWTPLAVAPAAVLMILVLAATALIQTRLAEMAAASAEPRLTAGAPPAAALAADFTLSPDAVRPISMEEARVWNAALPFSSLPIQAARPFIMPPDSVSDYARALDCLTAAVYYEAASESALGQAAVAQVVLNRMRHPAFPKTVCGVVFQGQERSTGCQFSFTCDGALARRPSALGWARARAAASAALNGHVTPEVGMATHYHTDWVAPYWAERLVKLRQIDTHIFYRWTGGWGLPAAFTGAHAGAEPVIAKLAAVATYVEELPTTLPESDPLPSLELAPIVALARSEAEISDAGDALEEEAVPAPEPVQTVAAPPAPPPVLASPLDAPRGVAPQRRTRIAAPR